MMRKKKLKFIPILLCAFFVMNSLFSLYELVEHTEHELHECNDEHCAICGQITSIRTVLNHIRSASLADYFLFLPGFILLSVALQISLTIHFPTLISQKVRLDC